MGGGSGVDQRTCPSGNGRNRLVTTQTAWSVLPEGDPGGWLCGGGVTSSTTRVMLLIEFSLSFGRLALTVAASIWLAKR